MPLILYAEQHLLSMIFVIFELLSLEKVKFSFKNILFTLTISFTY